jgi:hypothetical protein
MLEKEGRPVLPRTGTAAPPVWDRFRATEGALTPSISGRTPAKLWQFYLEQNLSPLVVIGPRRAVHIRAWFALASFARGAASPENS